MSTVLLAVFNNYEPANRVREMLVRDGFPTDRVELTASCELGRAGLQPADSLHGKCVQFFRMLLGREDEKNYPEMLAQCIDNGAATITVHPRGALETARAREILQHAHPENVVGHDLTNHGWEHASARHESAWAQYLWFEHSPDEAHCIYCRMFPHVAHTIPPAYSAPLPNSAYGPAVGQDLDASRTAPFQPVTIRRARPLQSLKWLRSGWDDLRHIRSSLVYGILIATLGTVLLILGSSHPYFFAAAVSGYLLVGPIMTTGVCALSRRRAAGESLGFDESLQIGNPRELLKFGALLAAIAAVWFVASEVMLQSVLRGSGPAVAEALWGGFTESASLAQMLAYVASGAVLAGLVFSTSVVAVPLIIDRHASATQAMWVSMKATFRNLPAMFVWSALIVVLTAFGFLTMLIGMIVVAPLLGHSTWHVYRDLIE